MTKKTLDKTPLTKNIKLTMAAKSMANRPALLDHAHVLYPAKITPRVDSVPTAI